MINNKTQNYLTTNYTTYIKSIFTHSMKRIK